MKERISELISDLPEEKQRKIKNKINEVAGLGLIGVATGLFLAGYLLYKTLSGC